MDRKGINPKLIPCLISNIESIAQQSFAILLTCPGYGMKSINFADHVKYNNIKIHDLH